MHRYITSPKAKEDLKDIWDYTFKKWGEDQADKYTDLLARRFEWLAQNPQLGKKRNDIKEGYLSFPEGRHIVFYRIKESQIEIIGIPHQKEDTVLHIPK